MSHDAEPAAAATFEVTVLLFAALREQHGNDRVVRQVPAGSTVKALYETMFPKTAHGRMPVMFAVDEAYAAPTTVLHDGAVVAFLPPLGGG